MNFKDFHIKFLDYLEVIQNKSKKTIEQYNRHLEKFWDYLEENNIDSYNFDLKDLTLDLAEWFRKFLYKENPNISIKTANAYMISLRAFLKYAQKKQIKTLPPTSIELIKTENRQIEFLTEEELERLFNVPDINTLVWLRDLAIMKCIYSTGLRISELVNLNINDINLDRREFAIRWKWKKVRVVFLTKEAALLIKKYLEKRNDNFSPLFIRHNLKQETILSLKDEEKLRLTRFFITKMIKNYAQKAFILKNVSAHTLRHSFATTLLNNWADIRSIQEMLGHSNISTTQVYTHVTNPKLKETHKKFMK